MLVELILVACLLIAFLGIGLLILSIVSQLLGGAPFVTTPPSVMEEMMEMAEIRQGETVYDLGCGDARLLIEAYKKYGAQPVGIELSPFFYWLARLKTRLSGADVRLIRGNLFHADFSDADVVFCHLMPKPMRRLEGKFRSLRKGSRIVSFRFELPGWDPVVHIRRDHTRNLPPVFKYQV